MTCPSCACDKTFPKIVVSRGNPRARLMLIGEAPGAKENDTGESFVGRSGKLLDTLLEQAGINPVEDVFFCNLVKCRPPNNRKPTMPELLLARPWLDQQIHLVDPLIMGLVGSTAVNALLGIKSSISNLRGSWQHLEGRLVMPLFHPSYLLRKPSKESGSPFSLTCDDLLSIRRKLSSFKMNNVDEIFGTNSSSFQ